MGRCPRSASPSAGKRGLLHRLLVSAAAIVLLAAIPFAESVRSCPACPESESGTRTRLLRTPGRFPAKCPAPNPYMVPCVAVCCTLPSIASGPAATRFVA